MSQGFAGALTRGLKGFVHEVETRLKRLDLFDDQFRRGARELGPGQQVTKDESEQEAMDAVDGAQQILDGTAKPVGQFPGSLDSAIEKRLAAPTDPVHVEGRVGGVRYTVHSRGGGYYGYIRDFAHKTGSYSTASAAAAATEYLIKKSARPDEQRLAASDNAEFDPVLTDPSIVKRPATFDEQVEAAIAERIEKK